MIAVRDFRPDAPGFFRSAGRPRENFASALAEANAWIGRESIEVINIETIGFHESAFEVQTIRVWYRPSSSKPAPSPEI